MTIEDQIAVLFARTNPVPSLDLLDPIDPVDIDALRDEFERSSMMSELHTIESEFDKQPKQRPIFGLVAAVTIVVAAAVVIFALANRNEEVVATPVDIAERYMAAMNAHDAQTVMSLLADSVPRLDDYPSEIEQEDVFGWTYHVDACVELDRPSQVRCPYAFSNDITRALGTGPYTGSSFTFQIEDGEIRWVNKNEDSSGFNEDIGVFVAWMEENHPEAEVEEMYYQYQGSVNLNRWKQFLPEFVASLEG